MGGPRPQLRSATEEKPLEPQPSGPLYLHLGYHQIQLLLIFSLPQANCTLK